MLISRVLIVDDYEPWRRHVAAALRRHRRWQVVGEASDGLDAVRQAGLLCPDVILLDVGLPIQNGIQAARDILMRHPRQKILFVSEHRSPELVDAALATGASGYVVKSNAGRELLPAMTAVIRDRRFISSSLPAHHAHACDARIDITSFSHEVAFYCDEAFLLDDYAIFAEANLTAGSAVIVLTLPSRRKGLEQTLLARGVDVERAVADGRHRWMDVGDALGNVMVGDWPDESRFVNVMTVVVEQAAAASERRRVAAWGECAPMLLHDGHTEAAIRLEQLWDSFAAQHQINSFCAYSTCDRRNDEDGDAFQRIGAIHSHVHHAR